MAITLGLVEAVDDNGVYVSMPGTPGVLRGPYDTVQSGAVGDQVLAVTTDDGENVIVGLASAAAPRSTPASSTDNAVPRFDGTGGALQNSGVTIDDSNNVNITDSSDVALRVIASTGNPYLVRRAEDGSDLYDSWQSPTTTTRFQLRVTQTQWRLQRSESGTFDVLTAERTTGRVTIGAAGTTAGAPRAGGRRRGPGAPPPGARAPPPPVSNLAPAARRSQRARGRRATAHPTAASTYAPTAAPVRRCTSARRVRGSRSDPRRRLRRPRLPAALAIPARRVRAGGRHATATP